MRVLWSGPCCAVVVVSEVPWLACLDGMVALGAVDVACCYEWCPLSAECLVLGPVASLLARAPGFVVGSCVLGAVATSGDGGASWFGADLLSARH